MQANIYNHNTSASQNGNFGNGHMNNITGLDLIGA
jgi:hypothetical protein